MSGKLLESTMAPSAFCGVRISKFRHVYGQTQRREHCYEGLRISSTAIDSQLCAVNPKMLAVMIEVAGGGAFQVIPLRLVGKVDYHFGRVCGHQAPITDLKWNPFNDNVIASASEDATIKLWHVSDDVQKLETNNWLIELCGHSRKISCIEWHPTADGIIVSAGLDYRLLVWNVCTGACLLSIDHHIDTIFSIAFDRVGKWLATVSKDHLLRVVDARTGQLLQQGACHDGAKGGKVIFVGDRILTTGSSRASRRQLALWNPMDLSRPIVMQEIDSSSGLLVPFYDPDLGIVYIAGKGDGNVRYYEISDSPPFMHFLSEYQSSSPQRGFGVMPKRGLNVAICEIFRLYKVHATQSLIEPISFIVPRKHDGFHADLYPPTAGPTPAMSGDEWLCGIDAEPVLISLKSGIVSTTCKPVQLVRQHNSVDGEERKLLITADRNNDRKFRFLSEVTKPDYREVTQRDDYEQIQRLQQMQQKLSRRISSIRNSSDSGSESSPEKKRASAAEMMIVDDDVDVTNRSSTVNSPHVQPDASSSSKESILSHSPRNRLAEINGNSQHHSMSQSPTPPPSSSTDQHPTTTVLFGGRMDATSHYQHRSTSVGATTTIAKSDLTTNITKPGCIGPRALISRGESTTTTAHVKPFRVLHQPSSTSRLPPTAPLSATRSASTTDADVTGQNPKNDDLQKLYTEQCRRVRELLQSAENRDRQLRELEHSLATMKSNCDQLTVENHRQLDDIASLRYEIGWKDSRIEYLQSLLSQQAAGGGNNSTTTLANSSP